MPSRRKYTDELESVEEKRLSKRARLTSTRYVKLNGDNFYPFITYFETWQGKSESGVVLIAKRKKSAYNKRWRIMLSAIKTARSRSTCLSSLCSLFCCCYCCCCLFSYPPLALPDRHYWPFSLSF